MQGRLQTKCPGIVLCVLEGPNTSARVPHYTSGWPWYGCLSLLPAKTVQTNPKTNPKTITRTQCKGIQKQLHAHHINVQLWVDIFQYRPQDCVIESKNKYSHNAYTHNNGWMPFVTAGKDSVNESQNNYTHTTNPYHNEWMPFIPPAKIV